MDKKTDNWFGHEAAKSKILPLNGDENTSQYIAQFRDRYRVNRKTKLALGNPCPRQHSHILDHRTSFQLSRRCVGHTIVYESTGYCIMCGFEKREDQKNTGFTIAGRRLNRLDAEDLLKLRDRFGQNTGLQLPPRLTGEIYAYARIFGRAPVKIIHEALRIWAQSAADILKNDSKHHTQAALFGDHTPRGDDTPIMSEFAGGEDTA